MRTFVGLLCCCLFATALYAQTALPTPPTIPVKEMNAHVTHRVVPVYPPIAKAAHVSGDVVVGVEIDENGHLTQAVVISGAEMLRSNAIDAARQWTFSPVEIDGKPHSVRSAIIIKFPPWF